MTLDEIKKLETEVLSPQQVGAVLHVSPYYINVAAKQKPDSLGFPVFFSGNHAKIPKRAFIKYMEGA